MLVQFATQSYQHDSLPISAQQCVNAYAEAEPPDAKTPVAVLLTPGIGDFVNLGAGPVRGMIGLDSILYAVAGSTLYRVDANKVVTNVGGAVAGTGLISMATNGTQIIMVNGTNGYVYSVAGGFQLITDVDFHAANTVEFFDQMFLLDWAGTDRFFGSDLLDGLSYPANFFASAEWKPDDLQAVKSDKMRVVLFGKESIELWQNTGAPNFPFQRIEGAGISRGVVGPNAITYEDNTLFFLGEDLIFYRLQGASPVRVSQHSIESIWKKYSRVNDAQCCAFTFEGHKFIVLTFPSVPKTWVLDLATNKWHEKESRDQNGNQLGRWRGNCTINIYNQQLVGDAFSGRIGFFSRDLYTEWGNPIRALMTAPPIHGQGRKLFQRSLWIDMETGTGTISEPTIDTTEKVMLHMDGADGLNVLPDTNSGGDTHIWTASGDIAVDDYTAAFGQSLLNKAGNDANTVSLVHFNGPPGSTSFPDTNAGGSPHTWTPEGTAHVDTVTKVFDGAISLLDGASCIRAPDSPDWALGSGDFCVECYFYNTATADATFRFLFGQANPGSTVRSFMGYRGNTEKMSFECWSGGAFAFGLTGTTRFTDTLNTGWHHYAVSRSGTTFRLFVDGFIEASGTFAGSIDDIPNLMAIGALGELAGNWKGLIAEFRLTKGAPRYTANFTPYPVPFGIPGYLTTPDHSDYTLASNDFTIEGRFNCIAAAGTTKRIIGQSNNAAGAASISFNIERTPSGNAIIAFVCQGTNFFTVPGTTPFTDALNTGWHAFSFVRSGNLLMLFIDGVMEGSIAFTGAVNDSSNNLSVGRLGEVAGSEWEGWLDEIAFYNGVAKHTSNYIVPPFPPALPTERAPQALLDWSDDGGRTFTVTHRFTSMGKLGEYLTRVRWTQLGAFYNRTYRLQLPDPVRRTVIAAYADGNGAPFEMEK